MYKTTTFTSAHHHHHTPHNMIKFRDLESHPHFDHQTMTPTFTDTLISPGDSLTESPHYTHHHHTHLSNHHHSQFNSGADPPPSVFYPPPGTQFPYSAQLTISPQLSNYSLFATTVDSHDPTTPPSSSTPISHSMMMSIGMDSDSKSLFPSPPASTQMASPLSASTPISGSIPVNNKTATTTNSASTGSARPKSGQKNGKKSRCKECEGCRAQDCGHCTYCLDKKKFGGHNVIKQACKYRICIRFRSGNNSTFSSGSASGNSNINNKSYKTSTPSRLSADSTEYRHKLSHYSTTPTPPMQGQRLPSLLPFSSTTSSPEHSLSTGSGSMGALPIATPTINSNNSNNGISDCSMTSNGGVQCDVQQYSQYYPFCYDSTGYNWNYSPAQTNNAYHNSPTFTSYSSTPTLNNNAITGSLPTLSTPNNCYN